MAEARASVDQDRFSCPICLYLMKDPVTISCGHSFCRPCINARWILYDQKGPYSCPKCRKTFATRPVLRSSNIMLAEELREIQWTVKKRINEKRKKLDEVKEAVKSLKSSAQAAVEDSERIFTQLIRSIEKKRSEVTELIGAQEKAELSRAEELQYRLEQEIADLKWRDIELEHLEYTEDHIQFCKSLESLRVSSGSEDSTFHQPTSFDGVRKSLSDLKERLEEYCKQEFSKIPLYSQRNYPDEKHEAQSLCTRRRSIDLPQNMALQSRADFLQYYCQLTLDPKTAHKYLSLSEENRVVTFRWRLGELSDHPERFDYWSQVLSKESVSGRCYWEVERSGVGRVYISVSYKGIRRKGGGTECKFGHNSQSWSLRCSPSSLSFYHNNIQTGISAPPSSRIGVYVDHSAGTLSFYSVSDTMTLLHRVHTTFTQPLYAGLLMNWGTARLYDPK